MKLLCIGNSFSDDMTAMVHQLAKADGYDLTAVNLFEGGCSLKKHTENYENGRKAYTYELNGVLTDRCVDMREILSDGAWDVVTLQQASYASGIYDTYEPYIGRLLSAVREAQPAAEIFFHETWAYETDFRADTFKGYGYSQQRMYEGIAACRDRVVSTYHLPVIGNGDVIQTLRQLKPFDYENGGIGLTRDGFHLSMTYGRLAAALSCYRALTGNSVQNNPYLPENTDASLAGLVRRTVENYYRRSCIG